MTGGGVSQLVKITRITNAALDCQACGACCVFYARCPDGILAEPLGQDSPLTEYFVSSIKFNWPEGDKMAHNENYFMRSKMVGGYPTCIALDGEVGKRVSCSTYQERPDACRDFQAGSERCLMVRDWAVTRGFLPLPS